MPDLSVLLGVLEQEAIWGNTVLQWLVAAIVALVVAVALRAVKAVLVRRVSRLVERRAGDRSRVVESLLLRTQDWFLLVVALFCGSYYFLELPDSVSWTGVLLIAIALWSQAALWANALLTFLVARYAERHRDEDAAGVTTISALGSIGKAAVWVAAALLVAMNMGVEITPLVAGLGIGGIAVALAAQNILGDLFASVSIVLDKPFVLGDFIIVDDKMGSVEYIGLKTTRLHSLSGEQLVFSNTDLLKSRIHNYKKMFERRVLFTLGVVYDTPYETVAALPAMLREIIQSQQPVRFDRAHFARYGDSALIFEVVYYVLAADYNVYMDVQHAVNLAILRRFAEEKIEFAFPTQTVHLRQ